jgi:hypothetical protein
MIQVSKIEMGAVNLVQDHRITSPTIGWTFYRLTGLQNVIREIDVPDNTAPLYYVCIRSLYPNSMVANRHQTCKEIKEDCPSCKLLEYNGTHRTELHEHLCDQRVKPFMTNENYITFETLMRKMDSNLSSSPTW